MSRKYCKLFGSITALLLCLMLPSGASAISSDATAAELEALYKKLDAMVAQRADFVRQKRETIERLKASLRDAPDASERFRVASRIYDEYSFFDSDSAVYYANLAERLGHEIGSERTGEWIIKRANVYSAAGLFPEAEKTLQLIDRSTLHPSLLPEYYAAYQYLYDHHAVFADQDTRLANSLRARARVYNDSVGMYLKPGHPYALWWPISQNPNQKPSDEVYARLKESVDKSDLFTRNDAISAYWLSRAAHLRGDMAGEQKYLIYSAMADIRTANCDIASLQQLAQIIFAGGDLERAYNYVEYCSAMAYMYHNRIRMVSLYQFLNDIHKEYLNHIKKQSSRIKFYLWFSIGLLVLALVAIAVIVFLSRKAHRRGVLLASSNERLNQKIEELHQTHAQLSEMHARERHLNSELQNVNKSLHEANDLKERYIVYAFTMASDFINDMEAICKKLLRKAKTNQFGELRNELENPKFLDNEMKQFYRTFDRMFLSIYPNYINDLNRNLPEAERVELKDGELPNTRLRIYALHKLGITESAKIARMLRCSIQTVYNNRPRTSVDTPSSNAPAPDSSPSSNDPAPDSSPSSDSSAPAPSETTEP